MLCDDLEGWDGESGRKGQDGGLCVCVCVCVYIYIADS